MSEASCLLSWLFVDNLAFFCVVCCAVANKLPYDSMSGIYLALRFISAIDNIEVAVYSF